MSACCWLRVQRPPDKERQQAEAALAAARSADAETYATVEFQDAQSALKKYDAAVGQRDYRQALNHAMEARDLAYTAATKAQARKTELRSQADRLAADLDALITRATARLTSPQRPAGAAATRLRSARDAGREALQEARTHLVQLDYQKAVRTLEPVVSKLGREMPPVSSEPKKGKK